MNAKLPPIADATSERAVLGAMLLHPAAALAALAELRAEDFAGDIHRALFGAAGDVIRSGKPLDLTTLAAALGARGLLDRAGGLPGLIGLTEAVATSANAEFYAREVRARADLRRWRDGMLELMTEAPTATDARAFLARAQAQAIALTEDSRSTDVLSAAKWTLAASKRFEARAAEERPAAIRTGFHAWDHTGALRRGALVVLAARPGMGKTALALATALGVAEAGGHVLVAEIEMAEDELVDRLTGSRADVDTRVLEQPRDLDVGAWERVNRALRGMSDLALDLWAPARLSIDGLRARALRTHAARPLDLLVVDYMQLMTAPGRDRVEQVSAISRGLKLLAKELGAPVLALSQLNRDCEKRDPPIPQLSDLRESGSIEQDADVVAFLYREHEYDDDADPERADLIIAKHRHGPKGRMRLRFIAESQRFEDA